jgi:anaerobic selenocysteine-containing dehydrogenase
VPYADLVLPDTTYLERYDCISLLDRPIGSAHGPADAIRVPVLKPDRDVRPFQDVLIDLAGRLGLPNFVDAEGKPLYDSYADYMVRRERKPGIGPLAGFRGEDGAAVGRGASNPDQLRRYVENSSVWRHHLPAEQLYYKHSNRAYSA